MAVDIYIHGSTDKPEYRDAKLLKDLFDNQLPKDIYGKIIIANNQTLFGQKVKDIDLIVIGQISSKFTLDLNCPAQVIDKATNEKIIEDKKVNQIRIRNFCACIETKSHPTDCVEIRSGNSLWVYYSNKGWHSATEQSEEQKYSLLKFFKSELNLSPFINNLIWLTEISDKELDSATKTPNNNWLPSEFSIQRFFEKLCLQSIPVQIEDGSINLWNFSNRYANSIDKSFELFETVKKIPSFWTRKKLEQITSKLIDTDTQEYSKAIGQKLLAIRGRAGTGKTIKLLRLACDMQANHAKRCLILTYNHALVSDIRRNLALIQVPDGFNPETPSVNCMTIHKFIYDFCISLEISLIEGEKRNADYIDDFIINYDDYLNMIVKYLDEEVITIDDIQKAMKKYHNLISWDIILIDESQDWKIAERDILFKIFGSSNIIIADGLDQFVRSQTICPWREGVPYFDKRPERKNLRQRSNIAKFVNLVATEMELDWELIPQKELVGGKIIICETTFDFDVFKSELANCLNAKNQPYEMLFLTPPLYVKTKPHEKYGTDKFFDQTDEFRKQGFELWDGTQRDLRTDYPTKLSQHRLLQYDSCRGLEGWTVVCLALDEFVRYKIETLETEPSPHGLLPLENDEDRRKRFVNLWTLIPLTRCIDTLIITLKNTDSIFSKMLKKIYMENTDFIQWESLQEKKII